MNRDKDKKDKEYPQYKRGIISDEDLSIECILGHKKQNIKKAQYNRKMNKYKIKVELENNEE